MRETQLHRQGAEGRQVKRERGGHRGCIGRGATGRMKLLSAGEGEKEGKCVVVGRLREGSQVQ